MNGEVEPPDGLVRLWIPVGVTSSPETVREKQRERETKNCRRCSSTELFTATPTTQRPAWRQEILTFPGRDGGMERDREEGSRNNNTSRVARSSDSHPFTVTVRPSVLTTSPGCSASPPPPLPPPDPPLPRCERQRRVPATAFASL